MAITIPLGLINGVIKIGATNPSADLNDFLQGLDTVPGPLPTDPPIAANDFLVGLDGMDVLDGLAGLDFLIGGLERDSLYGGAGNDFHYGGDGNDTVVGVLTQAQVNGSAPITPTSVLVGSVSVQTLGSGEVDVIISSRRTFSGSDTINLGFNGTPFYLGNGNADAAIIVDADVDFDTFILAGSRTDYTTQLVASINDPLSPGRTYSGMGIFYTVTDATGVTSTDLVALMVDRVTVDLNDTTVFIYEPAPPVV